MIWPFAKRSPKPKRRPSPQRLRAYQAASLGRLVADWNEQSTSADTDIIPHLRLMRARSRDLCQNNDYAKRFLSLLKTNVIGHKGILLQNKATDPDGQLDNVANDKVETAWRQWGKKGTCTMCGGYSWVGFQHAVIESIARDGEVLVQKVRSGPFGLSLHLIESDHLDEQYNDAKRGIKGGVQFDEWGRPIRYFLLKSHPGDGITDAYRRRSHTPVEADQIIHLYLKERPGQTRGCPWIVTPAYRLKQLGGLEEAELVASRIAASKMGFYTSEDGEGTDWDDEEEGTGALISEAEPGSFEQLPPGVDFKAWDPTHPNTAFESFCKSLLRGISSGLNVSYVSLANDLEGVSYSSIRQGELADRDAWRLLQGWLIENLILPVFDEWLPVALLSGQLDLPARKVEKFNQPHWMPRGWSWVDPEKEVNATVLAVRNGLKSLSDAVGEQGYSVEDVFARLAREKELAEKYDLDLPVLFGGAENATAADAKTA